MIRISPVRLIGADNEQVGVVETSEAMKMAQEAGLDLVEVVADSRPPVCKIMDYGKFKYEQSKKQKKGAGAGKAAEMKEIRLGRSVKIDPHDIGIRIDQARRFLMAGHKVLVTQRFRGREMAHKELGLAHLRQVADELADVCKVEQPPRWSGRAANIVIAPDKPKIDAIKAKLKKDNPDKDPAPGKGPASGKRPPSKDEDNLKGGLGDGGKPMDPPAPPALEDEPQTQIQTEPQVATEPQPEPVSEA
jgi:translation initiation factor IF-3